MGACTSKKKKKDLDVYFVNETIEEMARSVGFSKALFKHKEWDALKSFCQKRDVHTYHLNDLFNRYLSLERNPEAFIREFRVKTSDTKVPFLKQSRLFQELADLYMPLIYMRDYKGLDKPHSMEEVSFARFSIMAYIFCAQPPADLIFDCLVLMRNRMKLSLKYTMYTYNVLQIVLILTEEMQPSETLKYLLKYINLKNDNEISMQEIVNIGLRYPILFYSLFRFRHHYKRLVFGDKFWADRKMLKARVALDSGLQNNKQLHHGFDNLDIAKRDSARAIIADINALIEMDEIMEQQKRDRALEEDQDQEIKEDEGVGQFTKRILERLALSGTVHPPIKKLPNSLCTNLKSIFGYQFARNIILESELPYDQYEQSFLNLPLDAGTEPIRWHDSVVERDFLYNAAHGTRLWVTKYYHPTLGDVLKETTYQYAPRLRPVDNGTGNAEGEGTAASAAPLPVPA